MLRLAVDQAIQHPVVAKLTQSGALVPDCFDELVECIRQGGVAIAPTDTLYGIFGLASNPAVVERIARLKGRAEGMPFPVAVSDCEMALELVDTLSPDAIKLTQRFWPGALTIVLPAREGLPEQIASNQTIGVRAPDQSLLLRIIRCVGHALTATSANLTGGAQPTSLDLIDEGLRGDVDYVVDGGRLPGALPSTVIDLTKDPPQLLRIGAVNPEDIEAVLGKCVLK